MTAQTTPNARAAAARLEEELFARLGLAKQASSQEVEDAHDAIIAFLGGAPHDLRTWSQRQVARVDEAYALLSDPATDLAAYAAEQGTVTGLAAAAGAAAIPAAATEPAASILDSGATVGASRPARARGLSPVMKAVVAGAAIVAVITVGYVGYTAGATSSVPGVNGTPAPEPSAAQLDTARIGTLMQKIQANPKDTASLAELGDIYFQAGDYKTASDWMTKILAIDPKNIPALLGLGAAEFNQSDAAGAEKQWRAVLAIDPRNQEAYYDLGFMYLSETPPDMTNVTAMWDKVIAIDPTTDIAKTVQTHLDSFASASPGASGAASPSAATSPATSPAPSASPSASGN